MDQALTCHLYRKEEVIACLRHAILARNMREAVFWGLELFDSSYELDAFGLLGLTWMNQIGLACFGAWVNLVSILNTNELDRDQWIQILISWCKIQGRDTSPFVLLAVGATTPTDWKPTFKHRKLYTGPEEAVIDCLRRGKALEAWLLARGLAADSQWEILEAVAGQHEANLALVRSGAPTLGTEIQRRALAFCLVSRQRPVSSEFNLIDIPPEIQTLVDEWDAEENLRKRRVFPIRIEALSWFTARGELPTSASIESDLQAGLEACLWNSPYWREILEDYRVVDIDAWGRILWPDSYREAFYDNYFPYTKCDIPDEWSRADREKSHGRGAGRAREVARKAVITNLLRASQTISCWNGAKRVSPESIADFDWEVHYNGLLEKCRDAIQYPLQPVSIRFEIS